MLPVLKVYLLGGFRLLDGETAVTAINTPRLQALLAYLMLHRHAPQPRQYLAFRFWPDSTEAQARTNLRYLIHQLRHALPQVDRFLQTSGGALHWRADAAFTLDVADFEQAIAQADQAERAGDRADLRATLERAVALYRGDLLPGCYDEWLLPERERLQQMFLAGLEQLILLLETQRDYRPALRYAQRLLQADPLKEESYRYLMRLHALRGDRAGVVRIYKTCEVVLQQELAVEPSIETQNEYKQSLAMQVSPGPVKRTSLPPVSMSRSHNLPFQLTRFIGREREMEQVQGLVTAHRLVMLAGPGGSGKTRLALAVAADLLDSFADGVGWVDLAPLVDETEVGQTVAAALGLFEAGGLSLLQSLTDYVRGRHLLLLLDNCEHVRQAVGRLTDTLLQAAPKLHVLATSRVSLGIQGEVVWSVPAMSIPAVSDWQEAVKGSQRDPGKNSDQVSALMEYESVQLFRDRAATVLPTFSLTPTNALAVSQICRRLNGLPLAIELAAARVKVLTVQQIAARLDNALHLLVQDNPAALPRQQTLRATVDWSYALLSDREQRLFRRLAGFAGSFSLEAVEAIAQGQGIAAHEALDLLSGLVDKSLVAVEQPDEESRFRLHEMVRQYAHEKLVQAEEAQPIHNQHLDFFLSLAETAEPHLRGGAEQVIWLNRLELEHDNLRAALQWSLQNPALLLVHCSDAALRLAGALWVFWFIRGHFHEGRRWAERALEATQTSYVSAPARGKALYTAGSFALFQGDYERARILSHESLALCRQIGDHFGLAISLHHLSGLTRERGDFAQAEKLLIEGLDLARSLDDPWLISVFLVDLGLEAGAQGHLERAITFYTEALALNRRVSDKFGIVYALINLAKIVVEYRGDYGQAKLYAEEGLALSREIGEKRGVAFALECLGQIAHHESRYEAAMELLQQALVLLRDVGDKSSLLDILFELAQLTQSQGEAIKATQLLAATEALRQLIGITMTPLDYPKYEALIAALQSQLDEAAFNLAWTRGAAMSLEQAVQAAVEVPR